MEPFPVLLPQASQWNWAGPDKPCPGTQVKQQWEQRRAHLGDELVVVGQVRPAVDAAVGAVAGGQVGLESLHHAAPSQLHRHSSARLSSSHRPPPPPSSRCCCCCQPTTLLLLLLLLPFCGGTLLLLLVVHCPTARALQNRGRGHPGATVAAACLSVNPWAVAGRNGVSGRFGH